MIGDCLTSKSDLIMSVTWRKVNGTQLTASNTDVVDISLDISIITLN